MKNLIKKISTNLLDWAVIYAIGSYFVTLYVNHRWLHYDTAFTPLTLVVGVICFWAFVMVIAHFGSKEP